MITPAQMFWSLKSLNLIISKEMYEIYKTGGSVCGYLGLKGLIRTPWKHWRGQTYPDFIIITS